MLIYSGLHNLGIMIMTNKSSCTLDSLQKYIEDNLSPGSEYTLESPIESVILKVDEMDWDMFEYLSGHEFCIKTKYSHIKDSIVYDVKLVFNVIDVVELARDML